MNLGSAPSGGGKLAVVERVRLHEQSRPIVAALEQQRVREGYSVEGTDLNKGARPEAARAKQHGQQNEVLAVLRVVVL